MSDRPADNLHVLLDAVAFAARAHRRQQRKDGKTPYVSHVFRVCLILRHVFGIDDDRSMAAALLHDAIEDTTTDFDDLVEHFGAEVAGWVAALTKDSRLPWDEREEAYCKGLAEAPWQVKACKLADVYDNLMDSVALKPEQRAKTASKARRYLNALDSPDLPAHVKRAWKIVNELVTRQTV
jgi:guanosine-3',5'-bis(diphosphate) 3'-pyrophosphohydrolase